MKKIIIMLAAAVVSTAALAQFPNFFGQQKISAPEKLARAEALIEQFYLEDVEGEKLVEAAIDAMLATLDPHSSYSDPEETKEMTQPLDGKFSGIGIQFNMLNDTLYVIQTTAGGPSEKVGLLPGDRILSADTVAISGAKKTNADIIKVLRGEKGSQVDIQVLRKGVEKPLSFRIIRDDIPLNSVDAAFMADKEAGVGYIKISRFAETTENEFIDAMNKLFREGMRHVIIDLEDNGGGYLGSAVGVAEHMLRHGDLVTYTESPKIGKSEYRVENGSEFLDGRVVVLVNQYSASASEILSGAMQDNDRGLIVGRRTFGKGLVQRPFPFPDGSMIKLTVSRYHTPSGRVIQKPYELGNADDYQLDMKTRYESGEFMSADSVHLNDSLRYETLRNRRPVYGGGGIMPDLFVPIDTTSYSDYYRDLVAKGVLNRFCITYVDEHRHELQQKYKTEEAFMDKFEVSDKLMSEMTELGVREGVEFNAEEFDRSREMMRVILKALIGRDIFTQATYYRIALPALNPTYQRGLELILDPERYNSLLIAPNN